MSDILATIKNIFSSEENNHQLTNGLLIFYLALAGNYLGDLFSPQMQRLFTNNRWMKHVIGLTTMSVSVVYGAGISEMNRMAAYTVVCYIMFLLSTKMDVQWNMLLLALLLGGYIINNNSKNLVGDAEDSAEAKAQIKKYGKEQDRILIVMLVVTLIGTALYARRQSIDHGANFNLVKYIFY